MIFVAIFIVLAIMLANFLVYLETKQQTCLQFLGQYFCCLARGNVDDEEVDRFHNNVEIAGNGAYDSHKIPGSSHDDEILNPSHEDSQNVVMMEQGEFRGKTLC